MPPTGQLVVFSLVDAMELCLVIGRVLLLRGDQWVEGGGRYVMSLLDARR
jgi:hypothetical protein